MPKEHAFVDQTGQFHCPCGARHNRGALKGSWGTYRCLRCGETYTLVTHRPTLLSRITSEG